MHRRRRSSQHRRYFSSVPLAFWFISTAELVLMLPGCSNASSDGHQPPTPLGRSAWSACGSGGFWVVMFLHWDEVMPPSAAAMVISDQTHVCLDKTRKKIEVSCGSSLTLHCGLKTYERSWLSWYFNSSGPPFENSSKMFEKIVNKPKNFSMDECRDTDMTYNLSNVNDTHSGWYFCQVTAEIPLYKSDISEGTEVVVLKSLVENTAHPSLVTSIQATPIDDPLQAVWWLWILLGVFAFILIVLLVCILRRRWGRSTEPDPVYGNTRPTANRQPSPRPRLPMDNLEVSSSKNLRTPNPSRRSEEGKNRYKV
ncbi:uncharacterized protein [Embiotoca jacksoni]|uniref:uncharacterized protein isoform X1 n=1 Tax=Embiotoca jacksoni TaxID=100190 RepID=UPI0037046F19